MKNNLLNKYLLSSYVAAVLFAGVAGVTTFFAKKNVQMAKEHPENQAIVNKCKYTSFICLAIIMASLVMAVFSGLKYPMAVRRRVKDITKNYLQDIFTRYPETREYRFILEDSKKLKEVAAIACNGLTENEQKEILDIVDKELSTVNRENCKLKSQKIENVIIDIVQKHSMKDPEYMKKILMAITNAERQNFMKTAQKVR